MNEADPYQPPQAVVRDPGEPGRLVLAGRGARLGAVLIEAGMIAILTFVSMFLAVGVAFATGSSEESPGHLLFDPAPFLALAVPMLVYLGITAYLLTARGQTIGKSMVGIKIVRPNGDRAGFWRIVLLRFALWSVLAGILQGAGEALRSTALFVASSMVLIVDALFIVRADRRCLHDFTASTIVVKASKSKLNART